MVRSSAGRTSRLQGARHWSRWIESWHSCTASSGKPARWKWPCPRVRGRGRRSGSRRRRGSRAGRNRCPSPRQPRWPGRRRARWAGRPGEIGSAGGDERFMGQGVRRAAARPATGRSAW